MKISCILCSYNRPRMIRDALTSVLAQSHKEYQLIVIDDSDSFDIHSVVADFGLTEVTVVHNTVAEPEVARQNRLAMNCNVGLGLANGDLVCYLGDDDYFYPDWFAKASTYFTLHPEVSVAFGRLSYHSGLDPVLTYDREGVRFFTEPVLDPYHRLDHNQVMHRRFSPPYRWNEAASREHLDSPDGYFWRELAKDHVFQPVDTYAAVKRLHSRNLQRILDQHMAGTAGCNRE